MEEKIYDTVVIGGGPGGYTAALYCARSGLSVAVLEKLAPGGQMATTGQVELDAQGYVKADETTRTSLPGVFAVGDVRTKPLRQIVTAAADGAVASKYIEDFLAQME